MRGTSGASLRADLALVARGLLPSRAKAAEAIAAGFATCDGRTIHKASETVPADADLRAFAAYPWVSRGGVKLASALDTFGIDAAGRACLDVGASTGGFTDVLLARGAAHVTAVDVGHSQMHPRIAADPRVRVLEKTDARRLQAASLPERPTLIVADVSFISLCLVLPPVLAIAAEAADLVALVKPQFEGTGAHNKNGVVRDGDIHAAAVVRVTTYVESLGWLVRATAESPIEGGDGNREWLLHAARPAQ